MLETGVHKHRHELRDHSIRTFRFLTRVLVPLAPGDMQWLPELARP